MKNSRGRAESSPLGISDSQTERQPAQVVSHGVFGEGEVLDTRWRGTELLVRFQSGLKLWLPACRLRFITHFEPGLNQLGSGRFGQIDGIQARRMVEAFRLGIVPHRDVESFTFGRDREVEILDGALESLKLGKGDVYLVEGEYGTGKTHLLEYLHHRALKAGMVVSVCQFDPQEVSPHRPKRVYREIVHNLRFLKDNHEYGFRDLLWQAQKLDMQDHVFFGPVLSKLKKLDTGQGETEVFWQWIEGESTKEYATEIQSKSRVRGGQKIPALYDFSTAADFYCHILSGLSWMARQLGLQGLVLLVDEAETVTHLWDVIYLTKGINFMEGLIRTAQADSTLRRLNAHMIHNQVKPVPYIYRNPTILLVLATTPSFSDYAYLRLVNRINHRIELAPLKENSLLDLFATLVNVYTRAYPAFDISVSEQKRIFRAALDRSGSGVRFFIKYCVESLDIVRTQGGFLG